jgi:hypothetical protein
LQIKPELRACAEPMTEAQRGVRRDAALPSYAGNWVTG